MNRITFGSTVRGVVVGLFAFAGGMLLRVVGAESRTSGGIAFGETPSPFASRDSARQDGRFIPRLEWTAPHGELPGTCAEYLKQHPLRPARFSNRRAAVAPARGPAPRGRAAGNISLLADETLYPTILASLDQYVADLSARGYAVFLETVAGGTPEDIKAWVQGRYAAGSDGIVFVGDITAAWAEVSGSVFPSDLFYMDLDGNWEDTDEDGDYETHDAGTGDEGPEIYVARIYAHTLNYDTEAEMVNGYFVKAHTYRTGDLIQPYRGLEYVDEDWYYMYVALDLILDDVVRYDFGFFTTASDYLNQMDLGQHFVQVCAHSYSGGHHFGKRPTESAVYAHVYVHSPSARTARLLLGSDDGIKVWLNGDNVLTQDVSQGWQPDQFDVEVTLDEGWNPLLCKVSQAGSDYQFSARFTDADYIDFSDLTYQIDDPATNGDAAPFVRGWLLNGFHQDVPDNFWSYLNTDYLGAVEGTFSPVAGEATGGKTWTTHVSNGGYLDLDGYGEGADYGATYAYAEVYSASNISCELRVGYGDGARLWLNGEEVLYDNRYGDFALDMTTIPIALNAGENRLLVKVSEWMGGHGFSARFCHSDGTRVDGLTFDPEPMPVSFIGTWLINGPYANPDQATRLTQDYLGGESAVAPSEGDPAAFGTWEEATSSGAPVDLGVFYNTDGGWVYSQTVQDRDPPVLFYNLFSCGPGRFTDSNYLAGAYIFNTTYGLITVASSKSGSMLNFQDFTAPLGEGRTVGQAFLEWFDAQAPFATWEREWYYGMILNGDPTLRPLRKGDLDRDGDIDLDDRDSFAQCLTGAGGGPVGPACAPADFDEDGDVDCADWDLFAVAWTGPGDPPPLPDCWFGLLAAPWPHDVPKNRYISFEPNSSASSVAMQVELAASEYFAGSVGIVGWVGAPDVDGVARVVSAPVYRAWPEPVVHAGDCEIVPAATYNLRAIIQGAPEEEPESYSVPLAVDTAARPGDEYWADCVGPLEMVCSGEGGAPCADTSECPAGEVCGRYPGPDGHINFQDIDAAVKAFAQLPGTVWPGKLQVDIHGDDFGDPTADPPNGLVNFSDIQHMVLAFQGNPYPFRAPTACP